MLGGWCLLFAIVLMSGCAEPPPELLEIHGETMGTSYSIKLIELPAGQTPETLQAALDARLERINDLMSTYRPSSALSRFNASRSTDWQSVDAELAHLVEQARSIHALSDGAFDVTVGPLVDLWGFGPRMQAFQIPEDHHIESARARIGTEKLSVSLDPPALRKDHPALELDLSAIAKGYGVDQIAVLLDGLGLSDYLVEIGGELRARGHKPDGRPWRIAIERPTAGSREVYRVIALEDAAMATSGDYRNFHEIDGRLYSHTIDPATGRPVEHTLASVTVIAADCARADALATALLVLGPSRGFELAESNGIAAFFVSRQDNQLGDRETTAFTQLTDHP